MSVPSSPKTAAPIGPMDERATCPSANRGAITTYAMKVTVTSRAEPALLAQSADVMLTSLMAQLKVDASHSNTMLT